MKNPFRLDGQRILITGASSGIGASAAIVCSQLGASVVLPGQDELRLSVVFDQLVGQNNSQIKFDLRDNENLLKFIDSVGKVDGVVHSAGISGVTPIRLMQKLFLENVMDVNFEAPALITRHQLARNCINNQGSIIFLSSIAAITGKVGVGPYSASKTALIGLMRPLAREVAKRGVRVNALCPGLVKTPLLNVSEEWIQEQTLKYPLGLGNPIDISNCIVYFLSDASMKVTGTTFSIDGGVPFT
jgi:NAD(P)-dependent dehydrogenase (short-subunit alcohol dehydrogenase family)